LAVVIFTLSLSLSANAGNTASGTVRLGVVLVSTVQAEPQPAAQTLQFSMGSGATLRIDAANAAMTGQVREIEVVIAPAASNAAERGSALSGRVPQSPPQATATLVQTTFVAD